MPGGPVAVAGHLRGGKYIRAFIRKSPVLTRESLTTFSYGRGSGSVPFANAKRVYTHVGRNASQARYGQPLSVRMSAARSSVPVQSRFGGSYKPRPAHHVFIQKRIAGGSDVTRHVYATPSSFRRVQRLAKAISVGGSSFTLR